MAEQREDEEEKVKLEALKIIDLFPILPRLIVFDLIFFGLYTAIVSFASDCQDEDDIPWLYPQARGILCALKDRGVEMAIASRSPSLNVAKAFLAKLDIQSMFVVQEIFASWTHKTDHFQKIHTRTGVQYNSMLFFDDEYRNIEAVSKIGVTCIWVDMGVNLEAFERGLTNFSQKSDGIDGRI